MVKSDVVETFLYGCVTWTPLEEDYQKPAIDSQCDEHTLHQWVG